MALTPEQLKSNLASLTPSDVKKAATKKVKPLITPSPTTPTTKVIPEITSVKPLAPKQNIMSPSLEVQAGVQAPKDYKSIASENEKTAFKRMLDDGLDPKLASETLKYAIDRRLTQENIARGQEPKNYVVTPQTFQEESKQGAKNIVGAALDVATGLPKFIGQGLGKGAEAIASGLGYEGAAQKIAGATEKTFGKEGTDIGQDVEAMSYKAPKLIGDIASVATAGSAISKIPVIAGTVGKIGSMGTAGKIAVGALEGAGSQGLYTAQSEQRLPTSGELAVGGAIGGAIPALPIVGKFAKEKILQPIQRTFGKKAEELAVKGLVNVNDAKNIVRTLKETGEGDVGSLGRWALSRGIAGKNTDDVISKLDDIKTKNYGGVREAVNEVSNKVGAMGTDDAVVNAMTTVGKNADSINARMGYNAVDNTEIMSIQKAAQDGTITLAQKQRAKELIDEFVNIYKKSGDVSDTLIASQADKLRNTIKNGIEDTIDVATNGKINIREMNREVAVAQAFKKAIETKSVANELKQYVIQGSLGGFTSNQGDFSTPEGWAKFLVGAFVGRQAGKMLGSPVAMGRIAKAIDLLSGGTRKGLLQYMKNPKIANLTEKQLGELLNVKNVLSSISKDVGDNIPMRGATISNNTNYFPIVPVKKATTITPTGVIKETAPLAPKPTVPVKKTVTEVGRSTHNPYASKVEPVKETVPVPPKQKKGIAPTTNTTTPKKQSVVPKPQEKQEILEGKKDVIPKPKELESLYQEAKKFKSFEKFMKKAETPKTVNLWIKSKFSNEGAYKDIPVIEKVDNITLYQGGSDGKRQFWTKDKKYAEQFGKVQEKTGSFYKVDNGNRVTDVYVEATAPKKQSVLPKPQEKQAVLDGKKEVIPKTKVTTPEVSYTKSPEGKRLADGKPIKEDSNTYRMLDRAEQRKLEAKKAKESSVSKELQPLYQEAKKYKTADEFIDKIADKYHGTDATFDEFDKKFRGSANGATPTNKGGIFFTDNLDLAKTFGKNIKKGYIQINKPKIIDANGVGYGDKFKDYSKFKFYLNDIFESIDNKKYDGIIVKNYKDAGKYGGDEILSTQYIPLNESQIKTESQLRKIREEAQRQ